MQESPKTSHRPHHILSPISNFSFTFLVSSFWAVVFCTSQVAPKQSYWWQHWPHLTTVVLWFFSIAMNYGIWNCLKFSPPHCAFWILTKCGSWWDDPRIIECPTERNDRNYDAYDTIGMGMDHSLSTIRFFCISLLGCLCESCCSFTWKIWCSCC